MRSFETWLVENQPPRDWAPRDTYAYDSPDIDASDTKIEAFIERRRKEFRREWEDYMDHFYSDEESFIFLAK